MTNLDSILRSRDITLSTKVQLVKAMVFPVVMYGCESWTIKKAEHQRIDVFELWCWRRLWSPVPCLGASVGAVGLLTRQIAPASPSRRVPGERPCGGEGCAAAAALRAPRGCVSVQGDPTSPS